MKKLNTIALLIFAISLVSSRPAYTQTQEGGLRKLNLETFEGKFVSKYCGANKESPRCRERWKNFSDLLRFIKADTRLTNIDIAAFIMTTATVETACVNFAPTVEGCGRIDPKSKYKPGDLPEKNYWAPEMLVPVRLITVVGGSS